MIYLITGGTGTLGRVLTKKILEEEPSVQIRILSRGEHKQLAMQEWLGESDRVDYFIGDVRDRERVWLASRGCDKVYHLAAMKSVDKAEYNPNEAIATNITGTQNVVQACIRNKVKKAVFTSTDKAVSPHNLYGASKLAAEKLFIQSNSYSGVDGTHFTCVRYGNVIGSNGSVLHRWKNSLLHSVVPRVTDPSMTRFWMTVNQAAELVLDAIEIRGAVVVPKMKASTIGELYHSTLRVLGFDKPFEETGHRAGEKRHECLLSDHDVESTTDIGERYAIWPHTHLFPVTQHGSHIDAPVYSNTVKRFDSWELDAMVKGVIG